MVCSSILICGQVPRNNAYIIVQWTHMSSTSRTEYALSWAFICSDLSVKLRRTSGRLPQKRIRTKRNKTKKKMSCAQQYRQSTRYFIRIIISEILSGAKNSTVLRRNDGVFFFLFCRHFFLPKKCTDCQSRKKRFR